MKVLLVYLPFCTPVSPPYSLTNLHAFLTNNSNADVKVLDLNVKFHALKFADEQKYFQNKDWEDYEKKAQAYHNLTKEVYARENLKVVKSSKQEHSDHSLRNTPEYFDEMLAEIRKEKPDVVAFSIVYSSQAFYAHALLRGLKDNFAKDKNEVYTRARHDYESSDDSSCASIGASIQKASILDKVITVIGGPAVSDKLVADYHFKNELEFLNFIEKKDHKNLKFDFPLDYSIYDLDEYFVPSTVIPLKTSTTCFYQQCTFCAHYAKVPYQEYDLKNIKNTIDKSGKKHFFLIDDMIPVKRLLALGEILKGKKWGCQLRPTKDYTREVFLQLKESGLTFVLWGVESGCQKTLDAIKKGTKVEDVEVVLKNSHEVGIKNVIYTMFGFPGETEPDFLETIEFLKRNNQNIDLVSVSTFGLQKGTNVYENPEKFGITSIEESKRTVLEPKISYSVKEGLSTLEVKKLRKKYSSVIDYVNKYPKTMNFFREHLFFVS